MLAYSKGDIGVGVYLGGQKGEGNGKTEEFGSGEVVAYKEDKMYVTQIHTHIHTHIHTTVKWRCGLRSGKGRRLCAISVSSW